MRETEIPTRELVELLRALRFASQKHRQQRRRDSEATPYINHPIAVAELLVRIGKVNDLAAVQSAILHDTVEDTQTSAQELEEHFGQEVRLLVQELTDDKSLPKQERKRLQVEHASQLSAYAKQIKISDMICNMEDITETQPPSWSLQRKLEYLNWAQNVAAGCRGCNEHLEQLFTSVLKGRRDLLEASVLKRIAST
jgi:guanosine-3',5'-bis(diphosphate) 3'-pyrophosphohydrolase